MYARKSEESEDRQVQSIGDQVSALDKLVSEKGYKVVKIFSESHSAKAPGRKEFNAMIDYLNEQGDIDGILCWAMNRLTRNPVDTGTLQWLIQNNVIKEIITPSRTYSEVDSDFVMAIEGAQANRFIRDLRKDTIRGLMSKVDKGIPPVLAPTGYVNDKYADKGKKKIIVDQNQFPLTRQLFDKFMTGAYSVLEIHREALRLGIKSNRGTTPISRTQTYELLRNPFYTGKFRYGGKIYQGTYDPMILPEEHELVLSILSGKSKPRQRKHELLSGFIQCGRCKGFVTGEEKTKIQKNGNRHDYTFYACNAMRRHNCDQPSISGKDLLAEVTERFAEIKIDPEFLQWAIGVLRRQEKDEVSQSIGRQEALNKQIRELKECIHNLFQLKISSANLNGAMIGDDEFIHEKDRLNQELQLVEDRYKQVTERYVDWTIIAEKMFKYAANVQARFNDAPITTKIAMLKALGSNLYLENKKLEVDLYKPFYFVKEANKQSNMVLEPAIDIDLSTKTGVFSINRSTVGG